MSQKIILDFQATDTGRLLIYPKKSAPRIHEKKCYFYGNML